LSTGVALNGYVNTATATLDTAWVAPKGASRVGLFIDISAEDSASMTMDTDVEQSPDKGTTFAGMPITANSETEATLAQFTAVGSKFKWWEHCGDQEYTRIRAELTHGGNTASDTNTFGPSFWIFSGVE
jgi:hypothetical protein